MPDMLVKLYNLENTWNFIAEQKILEIEIRKPVGPEPSIFPNFMKKQLVLLKFQNHLPEF
jgi:hypothetical protein